MDAGSMRELGALLAAIPEAHIPSGAERVRIRGVTDDTRRLRPGELFVARRGSIHDGHALVAEAARRGAAAIVAEREVEGAGVPVVRVPNAGVALAELAAAWHGRPADALSLVGITGTIGKTSVLAMLAMIFEAAGEPIATIGSLGVSTRREADAAPPLTTPDPLTLHGALAAARDDRRTAAAMEVTSHALDQQRVHGLRFAIGVFTNLTLLEHLDYHGSFRRYVEAKMKFFDHLMPGAPLIYSAGDRIVRSLVRGRGVAPVSCGPGGLVSVRVDRLLLDRGGTRATLTLRSPLPKVDGGSIPPTTVPIELRVIGRPNVQNAALAATTALCMGARPEDVRNALAEFRAPWRRMQIVHRGRFTVLDDTVGHPDSIGAVFEVARKIGHRRLHILYAIRGRRGEEINRRDAETLAIWSRCVSADTLIVTSAEDAVDDANRVQPVECAAFLGELGRNRCDFEFRESLVGAVEDTLARVGKRDLVLLLGAQGMNRGSELLLETIGEAGRGG